MVAEEYRIAYSEVLEILDHVPKEEYDKIDKKELEFYERNKKEDYNFIYDVDKTLDEQGVSKIAKVIIARIYRDFWASDEERKEILEMQDRIRKNLKNNMQIDFDPETAFKKSKVEEEKTVVNNEIVKVDNKSFFRKFIDSIKKLFTK